MASNTKLKIKVNIFFLVKRFFQLQKIMYSLEKASSFIGLMADQLESINYLLYA